MYIGHEWAGDTRLDELTVGDTVRALHPKTLGVVYTGTVKVVGRKWVHVHFSIDNRTYKMAARYITEVLRHEGS